MRWRPVTITLRYGKEPLMTYLSPPDDVGVTRPRVPPQYLPPYGSRSLPSYRPGDPLAYVPPRPPPEPARRSRPRWRRVALGAVLATTAVIGLGAGVVIGATRPPVVRVVPGPGVTETVVASARPATTPEVTPTRPVSSFGDGRWLVGREVRPGTYRTIVPTHSPGCYWERERGTSGRSRDVIADDSVNAGQRVIVTIKSTDKAFKAHGCGRWKRI
jgi:hypothetical protein